MVYVDDMEAKFGRMRMCHILADTTEELLAMVDRIGVARRWIQEAGGPREHFDIALSKKALALAAGAVEVEYGAVLAEMLKQKAAGQPMRPRRIKPGGKYGIQ